MAGEGIVGHRRPAVRLIWPLLDPARLSLGQLRSVVWRRAVDARCRHGVRSAIAAVRMMMARHIAAFRRAAHLRQSVAGVTRRNRPVCRHPRRRGRIVAAVARARP